LLHGWFPISLRVTFGEVARVAASPFSKGYSLKRLDDFLGKNNPKARSQIISCRTKIRQTNLHVMILTPVAGRGTSFNAIEIGLTVFVIVIAVLWPGIRGGSFTKIERAFGTLARRRRLAVVVVGATAFLARLAILPLCPIPRPFILDAFSYLLAADTYAHGRLTNTTPVMWQHFETFQVTMQPTYMSMYFPAHGMVLAAGQFLTGHPWFGLLFVSSLMCAAICWMLQAWVPPTWAFLGGLLAVMRLALFSYWIDTYSGGGAIAALGGALVLGALPRLMKRAGTGDATLLALGVVILANSRPYEGILLCLPVAVLLIKWLVTSANRPPTIVLVQRAIVPASMMMVAALWMGYYNYRVFGDPFTEPYKLSRTTYATAPHFIWQTPRPEPQYRHPVMREFYTGWELSYFQKIRTLHGFLTETPLKLARAILFYAGITFLPLIFMFRRVLLDRRTRFLVICVFVLALGMLMETWLIPHYLSPFTAAFYALGIQAMRHLRMWSFDAKPVGVGMVRAIVTACLLLTTLRTFAEPLHLKLAGWPTWTWYGSQDFGVARAQVQGELERKPGKQLAIVRYAPSHNSVDEWVYNAADIDHSNVIWAREMEPAEDLELIRHYKDRSVWLIQPDNDPAEMSPYAIAEREHLAQQQTNSKNLGMMHVGGNNAER
jgi:hypothetical protein